MENMKKIFANPGPEYRGKPFWSWNGELKAEELKRQVHVMKEMGLGGYFMHSRAGLITEYLGDEWFDLINEVADEGEKLGLESWLYDEDRWPSGSAGGKVTVDPQYRMKSLYVFETPLDKFQWTDDIYAAFTGRIVNDIELYDYQQIDASFDKESVSLPLDKEGEFKVLVYKIIPDPPKSVYNGTTYIDTMSYKATNKFIEMTHEEYKKRCGDRIGRSIKGIFTDEPHRGCALSNLRIVEDVKQCGIFWTDDIFEEFEKRYGYDAKKRIPEIFYFLNGERVSNVKLHYFDLGNALFIERFAIPINEWCKDNNIEFTGHVLHENSLANQTVPNGSLMRFYEHMGYPGIDMLCEFDNSFWVAKQLQSAAHQLDKKWLLSELYGCTGWQFDFKGHKAVGDWQALYGINLRCQHLSWYTMEGESKRDYPASILHQSAYYHDYDYVESYFARFGLFNSTGKPLCDVLVVNPIESVWCQTYLGWASWIVSTDQSINELERHYTKLFHILQDNHIDFDYGDEEMMSRMAKIEYVNGKPVFTVGAISYKTIIVSGMVTMRPTTVALLKEFLDAGGKVIFTEDIPQYVNAIRSDNVKELTQSSNAAIIAFDESKLTQLVRQFTSFNVYIQNDKGEEIKDILCQTRVLNDKGDIGIILINTNRKKGFNNVTLKIESECKDLSTAGKYIQNWDFVTGDINVIDNVDDLDLECVETKAFVFTSEKDESILPVDQYKEIDCYKPECKEFAYKLDEQNVCVLDFAKWKFKDMPWQDEDEALKIDRKIRDVIGIEHRSGDMLQPWYAKLNYKEVYGDVELEYTFEAEKIPEGNIFLAAERPEYNDYYINGIKLECEDLNDFWIDDCFKKLYIPKGAIKEGTNIVTFKTAFMRTSNIESIYLVGDFGVKLQGKTKILTSLPEKIGDKNLVNYDLPFYTGCITYIIPKEEFAKVKDEDKIEIRLNSFCGSLAKIANPGFDKKVMAWNPYIADITDIVKAGEDVLLTLVCSRKNMFGPLHILPIQQPHCAPGSFITYGDNWSDEYCLIDSGIFDFDIITKTKK